MSTFLRIALLSLLAFSAAAHGTGEPHVHAHAEAWLDALVVLLVIGTSSALTAQRAGADGRLRVGALWVTRACALGAGVSAMAAMLPAVWVF